MCIAISGACVAEQPDLGGGGPIDMPDAGMPEPDPEYGVVLNFGGLPPSTPFSSVVVHGQGPSGGTILVNGPSGSKSDEIGLSGEFCIDLSLEADTLNEFSFVAITKDGERSDPQSASVLQMGTPPLVGETLPEQNAAHGGLSTAGSATTNMVLRSGTWVSLADGDYNSSAEIREPANPLVLSHYFTLQLPIPAEVDRLRVYSGTECPPAQYYVHTVEALNASVKHPRAQEYDDNGWTYQGVFGAASSEATDCSTPEYSCQEFAIPEQLVAAVGINVWENTLACTNGWNWYSEIIEIEALTAEKVVETAATTPTCDSGA